MRTSAGRGDFQHFAPGGPIGIASERREVLHSEHPRYLGLVAALGRGKDPGKYDFESTDSSR